jgi:hypothetical protein
MRDIAERVLHADKPVCGIVGVGRVQTCVLVGLFRKIRRSTPFTRCSSFSVHELYCSRTYR